MAVWSDDQIKKLKAHDAALQAWVKSGKDGNAYWNDKPAAERTSFIEWLRDEKPATSTPPIVPSAGSFTSSRYRDTNTSFSGADIVATITPLGGKPVVFGEIQTISYSIYRPTTPIHTLGRINPKGVVRGPRTIAGSLIFTVFDRHVLKALMDSYATDGAKFGDSLQDTYGFSENDLIDIRKHAKTDELPPFDINISFMNEYGNSATMTLYGVYILTEGQTMSIEDMITENTMQYIAMDIDLMDYTRLRTDNAY